MPKILKGKEYLEAMKHMQIALTEAENSPCKRDKRGVVIVKNNEILGKGYNAPPKKYKCESKYCKPTCKDYTVHAEMNAIIDAVKRKNNLEGSRMYHVRAEQGQIMHSRKPRCYQCSKHILEFGIKEFVLRHEEGVTLYSAEELNKLSLEFIVKK